MEGAKTKMLKKATNELVIIADFKSVLNRRIKSSKEQEKIIHHNNNNVNAAIKAIEAITRIA